MTPKKAPADPTGNTTSDGSGDEAVFDDQARAARLHEQGLRKTAEKHWYLRYDPTTKTIRRVWTEKAWWRGLVIALIVSIAAVVYGVGYLRLSSAVFWYPLDVSLPDLTITTNSCDVYLSTEGAPYDFAGVGSDGYIRSEVRSDLCGFDYAYQGTKRCLSVQASLLAYPDLARGPDKIFDRLSNSITVVRRFDLANPVLDERRGERCKIAAYWGGNVKVVMLPGPGKLHIMNHRTMGFDYTNRSISVIGPLAPSSSSSSNLDSFASLRFENMVAREVIVRGFARVGVWLHNVTATGRIEVTDVQTGVFDLRTPVSVALTTPASACVGGGSVLRTNASTYLALNASSSAGSPAVPVLVVPVRPASFDVGVHVWNPSGVFANNTYGFSVISTLVPLPPENVTASSTNATTVSNSSAALVLSTDALPVFPDESLAAVGGIRRVEFRPSDLARFKDTLDSLPRNSRLITYLQMVGALSRPQLVSESWVSAKTSASFLSLFTLAILEPVPAVVHLNARAGLCPSCGRAAKCSALPPPLPLHQNPAVAATPVFACTASASDDSYLSLTQRMFLPVLTALPDFISTKLEIVYLAPPRDDACYYNFTLSKQERMAQCRTPFFQWPIALAAFVPNPSSTDTFSVVPADLGLGPQGGILGLFILSLVTGLFVSTGIIAGLVIFARKRFIVSRIDTLVRDEQARLAVGFLAVRSAKHWTRYSKNSKSNLYEELDFSTTESGVLTIGSVVDGSFSRRLRRFIADPRPRVPRTGFLGALGLGPMRDPDTRPPEEAFGYTLRAADRVRRMVDVAQTLSRKLLLLERSTASLFLVELAARSIRPPSTNPSVEEASYWARAHSFTKEITVLLVSVLVCVLPAATMYYPASALSAISLRTQDSFEGRESFSTAFAFVGLALACHVLTVVGFVLSTHQNTGYHLKSWKRGASSSFVDENKEKKQDRARKQSEDAGKGGGGLKSVVLEVHDKVVGAVRRRTGGGVVPSSAGRGSGGGGGGDDDDDEDDVYGGVIIKPAMTASEMRWHKVSVFFQASASVVIVGATWMSLYFFAICAQWTLLGLFVNPTKAAPFAVGFCGVVSHVVALKSRLYRNYNAILSFLQEGIAAQRNKQEEASANARAATSDTSADKDKGAGPAKPRKIWFPEDIPAEELRLVMDKANLNVRTIVIALVSSTAVIVAVLIFLYIGIGALTDTDDPISSLIGSGLSITTVLGLSLGQSPPSSEGELKQLASKLEGVYRKIKSNPTFAASESALTVLRKAASHFKGEEQQASAAAAAAVSEIKGGVENDDEYDLDKDGFDMF